MGCRTPRLRSSLVLASFVVLPACAAVHAIAKSGALDFVQAASETFMPGYSALVGRFSTLVEKASERAEKEEAEEAAKKEMDAPAKPESDATAMAMTAPSEPAGDAPPAKSELRGAGLVGPGTTSPPPAAVGATAPSASATPAEPAGPLEIEFDLLREVLVDGRTLPVPVRDGDALQGSSPGIEGENYKVTCRVSEPCYVYLVQIDATGRIDVLFPGGLSGGANPVQPGGAVEIPEPGLWFFLDETRGIEHVILLASRERNVELEDLLVELEKEKPKPVEGAIARVEVPTSVNRGVTRGAGGVRPGKARPVVLSNKDSVAFTPTTFLARSARTGQVVLTRWFRHE